MMHVKKFAVILYRYPVPLYIPWRIFNSTSVVTWARDDANVIDIVFIAFVRLWNCDDTYAYSDSLLPTMTCYTSRIVFFCESQLVINSVVAAYPIG